MPVTDSTTLQNIVDQIKERLSNQSINKNNFEQDLHTLKTLLNNSQLGPEVLSFLLDLKIPFDSGEKILSYTKMLVSLYADLIQNPTVKDRFIEVLNQSVQASLKKFFNYPHISSTYVISFTKELRKSLSDQLNNAIDANRTIDLWLIQLCGSIEKPIPNGFSSQVADLLISQLQEWEQLLIAKPQAKNQSILLAEILSKDSSITTFFQDSFLLDLAAKQTKKFLSLIFEVAKLALQLKDSATISNLLGFLEAYVIPQQKINIGHIIGQYGGNYYRSQLLELLTVIAEVLPDAVIEYLLLPNGMSNTHMGAIMLWNLGQGISINSGDNVVDKVDEKGLEKYIELLVDLYKQNPDKTGSKIQNGLSVKVKKSKGFANEIQIRLPKRGDIILRLFLNEFLSSAAKEELNGSQTLMAAELIKHSKGLVTPEAVALLSLALKPNTYLGSYFYLKQGKKPADLTHGALRSIFDALKQIDPIAAETIMSTSVNSRGAPTWFAERTRADMYGSKYGTKVQDTEIAPLLGVAAPEL